MLQTQEQGTELCEVSESAGTERSVLPDKPHLYDNCMSYSIQAVIATQGTFPAELPNGLVVIQFDGGVDLIPLESTARKLYGIPFLSLTNEGNDELPSVLKNLCSTLSAQGPVAYIEAEFFDGSGTQAHALISGAGADALVAASDDAINQALRWLGVQPLDNKDQFDTVGLSKHRETDLWIVDSNP